MGEASEIPEAITPLSGNLPGERGLFPELKATLEAAEKSIPVQAWKKLKLGVYGANALDKMHEKYVQGCNALGSH